MSYTYMRANVQTYTHKNTWIRVHIHIYIYQALTHTNTRVYVFYCVKGLFFEWNSRAARQQIYRR